MSNSCAKQVKNIRRKFPFVKFGRKQNYFCNFLKQKRQRLTDGCSQWFKDGAQSALIRFSDRTTRRKISKLGGDKSRNFFYIEWTFGKIFFPFISFSSRSQMRESTEKTEIMLNFIAVENGEREEKENVEQWLVHTKFIIHLTLKQQQNGKGKKGEMA